MAILLATGWTTEFVAVPDFSDEGDVWITPGGDPCADCDLPDHPNDLNAMHEAVQGMDIPTKAEYANQLCLQVKPNISDDGSHADWDLKCLILSIDATAAQRAESYLKAINKWEESE